MGSLTPVACWGLQVEPNAQPEPAFTFGEMPATVRITMAAIDPGEAWEENEGAADVPGKKPRATLKMFTIPEPDSDSEDEYDEDDEDLHMADLLDDDEDDEDSDDAGEGPSDPEKLVNGINGVKGKGKGKAAADEDEEDEEEDDDDDEEIDSDEDALDVPSEYVLCTLDPDNHYQQTLDITFPAGENVHFRVEGTHTVYLTGNILAMDDDEDEDYPHFGMEEDEEADLSPDEDELEYPYEEDESDELDDLENPRVMEIDEDEAAVPKLVKTAKGKNKRQAEDSSEIEEAKTSKAAESAVNGDKPLTNKQKKQLKKLKDNQGNAVDATTKQEAEQDTKQSPGKADKKVQFASTLVQGPSGSATPNTDAAKAANKEQSKERVVNGVTLDDRKDGTGPVAKKGSRVSMRYIGKLTDKKVFDSNKKGAPFSFKLGSGEVIKGWDIGVVGMKVGGERRITIPAHLAYGSKAQPGIPANSTLVFDVKLLDVK